MKVTILSENSSLREDLAAEYGLSMYVEKGATKLLFDMGSYQAFLENAQTLGIDLNRCTAAAFSHSHRDHCGGFLYYTQQMKHTIPVYVHRGFFRNKLWDHREDPVTQETYDETVEFIGPPFDRTYVFQNKYTRFRELPGDVYEVGDGIFLLGNFPIPQGDETIHPSSVQEDAEGNLSPDTFREEQVCVVRTSKGLVVLTGCAHNGIMNILGTIEERFPGEEILTVIGGTHLLPPAPERIGKTAEYFNRKHIRHACVCHCTGELGLQTFAAGVPAYVKTGAGFVYECED